MTVTSRASDDVRDDPRWEPEWISGFFHGVLYCGRNACREKVVVTGDYFVDSNDYGEPTGFLRLCFAIPALPLATPPKGTPASVLERIDDASRVVWADPASAANGLRRAVEALLDEQKVNKTKLTKAGKRVPQSTHERIIAFKTKQPTAAASLEAVKWVGNQGSHGSSTLTATDCIESAEFLDHALRVLYDTSDAELVRRAAAVNKRKGTKRRTK